jgi:uncharacterized ferritin-like protein (DUF455 family)
MNNEEDFGGIENTRTLADRHPLKLRFLRPVDTSAELKALLWQELKLSKLIGGWIPAVPQYETKVTLGRFAYAHNRHAKLLYERIAELPGGIKDSDWIPEATDEAYERLFGAADEHGFLVSYQFVLQRLYGQYDELSNRLDPILNAPTFDQVNYIFVERDSMLRWSAEQVRFAHGDDGEKSEELAEWKRYLVEVWRVFEARKGFNAGVKISDASTAGLSWPINIVKKPAGPLPDKAVLEERFPKYENSKPAQSYSDREMSILHDSVKQMIYIYAAELFAGETLSSVYYYVDRMPMDFYFDLARHMWDEFRHSQMGMRRLEQMGLGIEQFKWFGGPGRQDVQERFADLYSTLTMTGEACGFKKKRKAAEAFWKFGDVISAVTVEFDLTDERRHIDFGTRWGPELYKKIDVIVTFQEMAERARTRRLTELDTVPPEEIAKLAKNFPAFCGFHTSELAYDNY